MNEVYDMPRLKILLLILALLLAACSRAASPTAAPPLSSPPVTQGGDTPPYPIETPTPEPTPEGAVPFVLEAAHAGDVVVRGTGLAGVPIGLLDVTMAGTVMAQTVIRNDGTFEFQVPPLEAGHRLGILLGNLEGTGWVVEDFRHEAYFGPGVQNVPLIGFFFDTTMVQP